MVKEFLSHPVVRVWIMVMLAMIAADSALVAFCDFRPEGLVRAIIHAPYYVVFWLGVVGKVRV